MPLPPLPDDCTLCHHLTYHITTDVSRTTPNIIRCRKHRHLSTADAPDARTHASTSNPSDGPYHTQIDLKASILNALVRLQSGPEMRKISTSSTGYDGDHEEEGFSGVLGALEKLQIVNGKDRRNKERKGNWCEVQKGKDGEFEVE